MKTSGSLNQIAISLKAASCLDLNDALMINRDFVDRLPARDTSACISKTPGGFCLGAKMLDKVTYFHVVYSNRNEQ